MASRKGGAPAILTGLGLMIVLAGVLFWLLAPDAPQTDETDSGEVAAASEFVGSAGCRECHERFYELWAPSHHGLAMQPVTPEFYRSELVSPATGIVVGGKTYHSELVAETAWVAERSAAGEERFEMRWALGGKNVYYFLTPLDRGRLQVLPIAFDVREQSWFDTTTSMVRHFVDRVDAPVEWTHYLLTFNTSCYNCHVSQLSTNYDRESGSYRTTWVEPGINCESCHGSAAEHLRVCREAPAGEVPEDLKIIRTKQFSVEQTNDLCAPCHAKMYPLTTSFRPGDRYFDHFGLHTLENPDFFPDGRDLGENYTFTSFRMSPCGQSGQLDCVHCHTSSGRNRFAGERADEACLPCHEEYVRDPASHSFHTAESGGSRCVACHMPKTVFARMQRHDHSMLPPVPAATLAFGSPNACNICHVDRDAEWSEKWVGKWYGHEYEVPLVERGRLIDAARRQDWSRLPDMLAYLTSRGHEEVFATSLTRLLSSCPDDRKWPALVAALEDESPLVRAAAASSLSGYPGGEAIDALVTALRDDFRLVRNAAATVLAGYPLHDLAGADRDRLQAALREVEAAYQSRPDDWASAYNLGNIFLARGEFNRALASFELSNRLGPDRLEPLVNAAMVHARLGQFDSAETGLRRALRIEPGSAVANFNLGLLLAEAGHRLEAEQKLRAALEADPAMAEAAYNLGVLLAFHDLNQAVKHLRKATELMPGSAKYAYSLGFYLHQSGRLGDAAGVLRRLVEAGAADGACYALLGQIYQELGRLDDAKAVYRRAAADSQLPVEDRRRFLTADLK